jgi:hypothetical protein
MDVLKLTKEMKMLYSVSDVPDGFKYWFFKLLNVVMDMFEYEGLPKSLPAREMELNLLMTGHAMIVPVNDGLFCPISSISGVDRYYQPTWGVFANPVIRSGKKWILGVDCEVIYNNSLQDSIFYVKSDSGLYTFLSRYARQLADIESSINIYIVNTRATSMPVTDDNSVVESIKLFFKKLAKGERAIITDNNIIQKFRSVDINPHPIKDGINDLLIARDKILEQFYRDIGIRMYQPKKAQVTESELESNDQLLLINSDDMLKARKEGLERVNNMYGTDISVKLNSKFDVKEVAGNEQTYNRGLSERGNTDTNQSANG